MATPPVDHFRQAILARVPGITRDLVDIELRIVVSEFLTRTMLWRQEYEFTGAIGADSYIIPVAQAGVNIAAILDAHHGRTPLRLGAAAGFYRELGVPRFISLRDARTVRVWPSPQDVSENFRFTAALTVDMIDANPETSFVLPYEVVPYSNALMDGVLARLYSMPDKPWTSKTLMEDHRRLYRRGMSEARLAADEGRVRGAANWRFPRFM